MKLTQPQREQILAAIDEHFINRRNDAALKASFERIAGVKFFWYRSASVFALLGCMNGFSTDEFFEYLENNCVIPEDYVTPIPKFEGKPWDGVVR